ncbi:MAG: 50S ribosomal protein L10 [Patescibacteria group bacterium]|nr:50S ribosomal protein L10 [Patescibacteria group bacterium]
MAITRQKKGEIVAKVESLARQAKTIVFANFKGLNVASQNEMRKSLRAQNIGYTVAKKTLLRRGLEAGGFKGQMPEFNGEIAVAYGNDELAPAREVAVFVKKFPKQLALVGGVFGGAYVGKDEIISIASIPGMQALRTQFVQLINSPIQRFAVVLNAKAEKGE